MPALQLPYSNRLVILTKCRPARGPRDLPADDGCRRNIANVLLVLGIAAMIGTILVTSRAVRIDIPVMIAVAARFEGTGISPSAMPSGPISSTSSWCWA
mgnify:CR=1 FL=1